MDETTIKKLQESINKMRAKVVAAKGSAVEGLTPLPEQKEKTVVKPSKTREVQS